MSPTILSLFSKSFKIVSVLIFFTLPFNCLSQSIYEEKIIGDWIFDFEISLSHMSEDAKNHYKNLNPNHQAKIQEAYQNRKLRFEKEGKFSQELGNGNQVEGSWRLVKNNSIEISTPEGRILNFKVVELNEHNLILMPIKSDEKAANMLFSEWHLIKG